MFGLIGLTKGCWPIFALAGLILSGLLLLEYPSLAEVTLAIIKQSLSVLLFARRSHRL
jgi:hypothetical protein